MLFKSQKHTTRTLSPKHEESESHARPRLGVTQRATMAVAAPAPTGDLVTSIPSAPVTERRPVPRDLEKVIPQPGAPPLARWLPRRHAGRDRAPPPPPSNRAAD